MISSAKEPSSAPPQKSPIHNQPSLTPTRHSFSPVHHQRQWLPVCVAMHFTPMITNSTKPPSISRSAAVQRGRYPNGSIKPPKYFSILHGRIPIVLEPRSEGTGRKQQKYIGDARVLVAKEDNGRKESVDPSAPVKQVQDGMENEVHQGALASVKEVEERKAERELEREVPIPQTPYHHRDGGTRQPASLRQQQHYYSEYRPAARAGTYPEYGPAPGFSPTLTPPEPFASWDPGPVHNAYFPNIQSTPIPQPLMSGTPTQFTPANPNAASHSNTLYPTPQYPDWSNQNWHQACYHRPHSRHVPIHAMTPRHPHRRLITPTRTHITQVVALRSNRRLM